MVAIALGLLALVLSGCSMLKFNVGGEPMPSRDLSLRMQTREFASVFASRVGNVADAIAARSSSPEVRANTIRWKLAATAAVQQSSLRTEPMLALVDSWTLCRQMNDYFANRGGDQSFSTNGRPAVQLSAELEEEIVGLARRVLSSGEFDHMSSFVDGYCSTHPLKSLAFERESVALQWLREDDTVAATSVGNMAEAITDLSDRVSGFSQQIPVEVRWRIDLERVELEPFAAEMKRLSAGAEAMFQSFPVFAENARVLADNAKLMTKAANELTKTLSPELARFDQQWISTLATIKTEREAVMDVVRTERTAVLRSLETQRESLVRDFGRERAEIAAAADRMTQNAISQAGQQVRETIRSALLYSILLVLVLLGLPFLSGYWVGRAAHRRESGPSGSQDKPGKT